MDRTVRDVYRAEEKELSDNVHRKLEILTFITAPTKAFKEIFVEDMFLKPNQKAFFHVMHFIFNAYDPIEFKKRFYWPLNDKKSERMFRTSTLDYLNYLNTKNSLQWTQVKAYLAVMPGGKKFLGFLNSLLDFVASELIKQREKYLPENMTLNNVSGSTFLKRLETQSKHLKSNARMYNDAMETQTQKLQDKIYVIRECFQNMAISTEIPVKILIEPAFIEQFANYSIEILDQKITTRANAIIDNGKNAIAIRDYMNTQRNQKTDLINDPKGFLESFDSIAQQCPDIFPKVLCGKQLNLDVLLKVFNYISGNIENKLQIYKSLDELIYQEKELLKLKNNIYHLDNELTKYSHSLTDDFTDKQLLRNTPVRNNIDSTMHNMNLKLLSTPPVLNFFNGNNNLKMCLASIDEQQYDTSMRTISNISFSTNQTLLPDKSAKKNNSTRTIVVSEKAKSTRQMIKNLTRKKHDMKQTNLNFTAVGRKLRDGDSFYNTSGEETPIKNPSRLMNSQISSNKTNQGAFNLALQSTIKKLPGADVQSVFNNSIVTSPEIFNKKKTIQHIQDSLMDLPKLSTSPSGRLDFFLEKRDGSAKHNHMIPNISLTDENGMNASNLFKPPVEFNEFDSIFNISDSILTDLL